jgi:hypothetical protein
MRSMLQTEEPRKRLPLPSELPGPSRWRTLAAYLALLAVPCILLALFLVFVVTSSAGAAGGCGGG